MADLAVWQRTIVDEEGNVVPGAEVEVRREDTGQLAEIFSDREGATPQPNPFSSFSNGFARFYVESGAYRIVATGAGATNTWRFVPLGTAAEYDIGKLALFDNKIVRIPSDYPTIMDAIRDLYTPRMPSGKEITLLLEKGYQIPSGSEAMYQFPSLGGGGGSAAVLCKYGDYSHFVVRSEDDAIIEVANNFSGSLFVGEHALMPRLECLIDMKGLGNAGYMPTFNSHGWIEEYCGVQNAGRWGARARVTSILEARGAVLKDAGERGAYIAHGCTAYMRAADCSGAGEYGVTVDAVGLFDAPNLILDNCDVGIRVMDCGDIHIRNASAKNCTTNAIAINGAASVSAVGFDGSNCGSVAALIEGGAHVDFANADLSGAGGWPYRIFGGGNIVNLRGANLGGAEGTMHIGSIVTTDEGTFSRYAGDGSLGPGIPVVNKGRFGIGASQLADNTAGSFDDARDAGLYGLWSGSGPPGPGWSWVHLPRTDESAGQLAVRSNPDEEFDLAAVRTSIDADNWHKWRQLVHTGRIVGEVSDDAEGDPNGSIFQSGGTHPEGYILYADGTMECWTYVDLGDPTANGAGTYEDPYRTAPAEWDFPTPVSFVSRPVVSLTPHSDATGSPARALTASFRTADRFQVTDVQVFRMASNTNTAPVGVNIHVKGRWK